MPAVIFDVDRVLVNSTKAMSAGCKRVFEVHGGDPPATDQELFSLLTTPFGNFYRERGAVGSDEEFTKTYFSVARHDDCPLFADVNETLRQLSRRGVVMGIVSGHHQDSLEKRFWDTGLRYHFHSIVGSTHDKVRALRDFGSTRGIASNQVLYVGDLRSDVRDARAAGIVAVGITRESGTGPALLEAGADHCIDHLGELVPLVAKITKSGAGTLVS